jgi:glycine C-acetyltransferase
MQDFSNVICVSSGSKCLSTNLGFVGCNSRAVIEYLKIHCTAYMFTNAVNPI